jgi:hypothetical protein
MGKDPARINNLVNVPTWVQKCRNLYLLKTWFLAVKRTCVKLPAKVKIKQQHISLTSLSIVEVIIKLNTKFIGICNLFACECDHRVYSAVQTPVFHLRLRPNYSSELGPHHKILNKCFTIREHLLILLW